MSNVNETKEIIYVDMEERLKNTKNRAGRKSISEEKKNEIVLMYNKGDSVKEISEKVGLSVVSVYKVLKERTPKTEEE